jgi:hypothetical protein
MAFGNVIDANGAAVGSLGLREDFSLRIPQQARRKGLPDNALVRIGKGICVSPVAIKIISVFQHVPAGQEFPEQFPLRAGIAPEVGRRKRNLLGSVGVMKTEGSIITFPVNDKIKPVFAIL